MQHLLNKSLLLIEDNHRVSVNQNEFVSNAKSFFNLRKVKRGKGKESKYNDFTVPSYLKVESIEDKYKSTGQAKEMISKFNGWLTINATLGMDRKTAP